MNSIQATESDTAKFLAVLEAISRQQQTICGQLDELLLLMQLPSESVLQVLHNVLAPLNTSMGCLAEALDKELEI